MRDTGGGDGCETREGVLDARHGAGPTSAGHLAVGRASQCVCERRATGGAGGDLCLGYKVRSWKKNGGRLSHQALSGGEGGGPRS